MGEAQGPGFDLASFDSNEDYEMYMKLMSDRRRIQVQMEDKRRKQKDVKLKKHQQVLEEREKGFEVHFSGANNERVDDIRRRGNLPTRQEDKRGFPPSMRPPSAGSAAGREWQMETVELRGNDGEVFRTSPGMAGEAVQASGQPGRASHSDDCFEAASDDDAIREDLPSSRGASPSVRVFHAEEASASRPGSAGSQMDQETCGLLRVMETANHDQLAALRESLTTNIERRVVTPGRTRASNPLRSSSKLLGDPERSRPSSAAKEGTSRPSSSSSVIAEAMKAENARVKATLEANSGGYEGGGPTHGGGFEGGTDRSVEPFVDASSSSRPPSRPSSKGGRARLPLSPEAALESAPPSVLSGTAPTRRPPIPGSNAGYGVGQPSLEADTGGYAANQLPVTSDSANNAPILHRPPPTGGYAPTGNSTSARADGGPDILDKDRARADGGPDILDRVSKLDRRKQKALLRVLDSLEAEKSSLQSPPKAQPTRDGSSTASWPPEATIAASPRRDFTLVQPTLGASALRLRVVSNWGSARQCGLSLIQAVDKAGDVLRIPPAALSLHGTQSGATTLARVLEGAPNVTTEKAMWVATVCPPQAPLDGPATAFEPFELVLNLPDSVSSPAALRLWNFNSPDNLEKGVKDVEVWKNGARIWVGQIPIGSGNPDNSPALAVLDPGFSCHPKLVPSNVSAADASAASPAPPSHGGSKDRPIWLDGMTSGNAKDSMQDVPWDPSPTLAGAFGFDPLSQPSVPAGAPDLESDSPKALGRRQSAPTEFDKELEMSLLALDQFRCSQSRKFFGNRAKSQDNIYGNAGPRLGDGLAQSADDWRPDVPLPQASASAGAASPSPAEAMAGSYTADFGGRPPRPGKVESIGTPEVMPEPLCIDGMVIPVLNFDGGDDGLIDDSQPGCFMGSSIVPASMAQSVVIPMTPCGRTLVFNCVSTWGDQNFVGLAGIEIFDSRGMPVVLKDVMRQVVAHPPSINVLPEYENDPRTVDKLFDQVNLTRDDLHVWLAPFFPGQAHTVTIDLERSTHLSMIRVWNYNKSRLHSTRGVRDLEILLDDVPVFVGEIRQAPGSLTDAEQACEHILFTQDEGVLQVIEEHDWLPAHLPLEEDDEDEGEWSFPADDLDVALRELVAEGPLTNPVQGNPFSGTTGSDGRPMTRASDRVAARGVACENMTIVIHSTWGDAFYVGLTAIELLDTSLQPIPLEPIQVDACPRDLNDLEGVDGDLRTIDKLLDGVSCTTDDHHMWLAPFNKVPVNLESRAALNGNEACIQRNLVHIDFGGERQEVAGLHIWNYNKNVDDTCRGVKEFSVYCDEKYIATFLCRKAPGHVHFDFKQVILLGQPPCMDTTMRRAVVQAAPSVAPRMPSRGRNERPRSSSRDGRARPSSRERPRSRDAANLSSLVANPSTDATSGPQQQYETPTHPWGFVFRLVFLSSWSDAHYIGLDGIELYDLEGQALRPRRVHSNHGSVRDLPGMDGDIRTEDNLLEGAPGLSGRMWLAPCVRQPHNSIELVFDEPTQISCLHIWNYTRTPSRGGRDIEIYVDDLLVYQGILRKEDGSLPSARGAGGARGEAVLFTQLPKIIARECGFVYLPSVEELVTFFDDDGCMDQQKAPTSSLERPMTSYIHQH